MPMPSRVLPSSLLTPSPRVTVSYQASHHYAYSLTPMPLVTCKSYHFLALKGKVKQEVTFSKHIRVRKNHSNLIDTPTSTSNGAWISVLGARPQKRFDSA